MKKSIKLTVFISLILLMLMVGLSFAMRHGSDHSGHGSSAPAASGHGEGHMGMTMTAGMEMLGTKTLEGVKAMAHISDISEAMAAAGMKQTHHLMVAFEDTAKMSAIDTGRVAVRILTPGGQTLPAVPLQGMEGAFGGDIELSEKGKYSLQVGTQLADGKTRQFSFDYEVK